jgi:hypothetical protein
MPKKVENDGKLSSNDNNIQNGRKTKEINNFGFLQENEKNVGRGGK